MNPFNSIAVYAFPYIMWAFIFYVLPTLLVLTAMGLPLISFLVGSGSKNSKPLMPIDVSKYIALAMVISMLATWGLLGIELFSLNADVGYLR